MRGDSGTVDVSDGVCHISQSNIAFAAITAVLARVWPHMRHERKDNHRSRSVIPEALRTVRWIRSRLHLGHRLYYHSAWVNAAYRNEARVIIVGGCDRSGTTLLRAALDSHPQVAAGPESWLFCYKPNLPFLAEEYCMPLSDVEMMHRSASGLAAFIDRFLTTYAQREGKPIWCEKSPRNVLRLEYIWTHFPNARFIHVIRDGRDVACSLRHHPKRQRVGDTYVPTNINRPIRECIAHWIWYVSAGIKHRQDPRYMEVRYEELVRDYAGQTRRICDHCDIEWRPELLERERIQSTRADMEIVNTEVRGPLYESSIGRWQEALSMAEQRIVLRKASHLLRVLEYL